MTHDAPESDADAIVRRFTQLMLLSALALFAVTWRLWTPQTVFPRIPFFAIFGRVPATIEWGLFVLTITALLSAVVTSFAMMGTRSRSSLTGFAIASTLLILLDQHRLQPWAYQFVLIAIVVSSTGIRGGIFWLRVLAVGIYAHSAFSKFDASFLDTHGQQLVDATVGVFGLTTNGLSETTRKLLAFSLPLGEFMVAIGLCFQRTRRGAVIAAIAMHAMLFLALGPMGLNHKPGVLIWNLFFIGQCGILFGSRWNHHGEDATDDANPLRFRHSGIAAVTVTAAILLPFLEPLGRFDHWPAWALYASHPERVTIEVHTMKQDELPEELRRFTTAKATGAWQRVDLDAWSLETLNVPIYPQGRFRLAVALAVAERARLGDAVRVVYESPANRRTGRRAKREIRGIDALRRETQRFQLNTIATP